MRGMFRGFEWTEDGEDRIWLYDKEIKGRWVSGDLLNEPSGNPKISWFVQVDGREKGLGRFALERRKATVLYDTVGEALRGRKDKNSRQIFEGDVVKMVFDDFDEPEYLTVYYDEEVNGFLCHSNQTTMKVDSDLLSDGEVIGTKWENLNYSNG